MCSSSSRLSLLSLTAAIWAFAGKHDWVNPSEALLATLRSELDLDQRDAADESDEGCSRGTPSGPTKKCRPWHWLKEMRCALHQACPGRAGGGYFPFIYSFVLYKKGD